MFPGGHLGTPLFQDSGVSFWCHFGFPTKTVSCFTDASPVYGRSAGRSHIWVRDCAINDCECK